VNFFGPCFECRKEKYRNSKKQKNRKRLYVSNLGMKTAGKNTFIRVWNTGSKYMGLGINHS
jgi:hypothetical protein